MIVSIVDTDWRICNDWSHGKGTICHSVFIHWDTCVCVKYICKTIYKQDLQALLLWLLCSRFLSLRIELLILFCHLSIKPSRRKSWCQPLVFALKDLLVIIAGKLLYSSKTAKRASWDMGIWGKILVLKFASSFFLLSVEMCRIAL